MIEILGILFALGMVGMVLSAIGKCFQWIGNGSDNDLETQIKLLEQKLSFEEKIEKI